MSELVYNDGNLQLFIEEHDGAAVLHSEMEKITPGLFKRYLQVLEGLVMTLRDRGIAALHVIVPEDEDKGRKYVSLFGFEPVGIDQSLGLVLYTYPMGETDGN